MSERYSRLACVGVVLALLACGAAFAGGDLVVLQPDQLASLKQHDLPVIWKGASFFLAEWDAAQQAHAKTLGLAFKVVARDLRDGPIWLFELHENEEPPDAWAPALVHRSGPKVIVTVPEEEARTWIDRGYHAARISRVPRGFAPPAAPQAVDCSSHPVVSDLLSRTSQSQWLDWIEKLSGAEPVRVTGAPTTIATRGSAAMFSGSPLAPGFEFLQQQLASWNYPPANIEVDPYLGLSGATWKNLILTIPGQTTPADAVLFTAHYDSRAQSSALTNTNAPGADDNGTGSASLLEAARLFRQYRFGRTVKLIWFTGEEDGLIGSEAYVVDHSLAGALGVVNIDMMGYDGNGDRCMEIHVGTLPQSLDIGNCFQTSLDQYTLGMNNDFLTTGATDRSDHASFWNVNVGAIEIAENFFTDNQAGGCPAADSNPNYHTVTDLTANMMPSFGFDIGRTGLAAVAALANPIAACFSTAPGLNAVDAIKAVDLTWSAVPGATAYRIYRSDFSCHGQWLALGETAALNWTDGDVQGQPTWHYYVEAIGTTGCASPPSNCSSVTPTDHEAIASGVGIQDFCPAGGAGSGNGRLDPGETGTLPTSLTNTGTVPISGISGTASIAAGAATMLDPAASWPDLAPGQSANTMPNHFAIHVDPGAACGSTIDLDLDVVYSDGSNSTGATLHVGPAPFAIDQNFSAGLPAGWTVIDGGTGGGAASTWTTSNPGVRSIGAPLSAPFIIVDSAAAGVIPTQDEALLTPILDVSPCTTVTLTFANQFRRDSQSPVETADVDVSTNGGGSWTNVLRMQAASDGYTVPNTKTIPLTAQVAADPTQVVLRFRYYGGSSDFWWAIDNVKLACGGPICTTCVVTSTPPGEAGESTPLLLGRSATDLLLDWGGPAACVPSGYSVYLGDLSTLTVTGYSHDTALSCAAAGTSLAVALDDPRLGSADYFLVVAENGTEEGSYGTDASDVERPVSTAACRPAQDLATCP